MGGRFPGGLSRDGGQPISMAMSFGRLAGRKAAEGKVRREALRRASRAPQGAGRRLPPGTLRALRCARTSSQAITAQGPLASLPERPWSCAALLRQHVAPRGNFVRQSSRNLPRITRICQKSTKIYRSVWPDGSWVGSVRVCFPPTACSALKRKWGSPTRAAPVTNFTRGPAGRAAVDSVVHDPRWRNLAELPSLRMPLTGLSYDLFAPTD